MPAASVPTAPAQGQLRRTARPDAALAAAPDPGGGTSTENRHQVNVMPSGGPPVRRVNAEARASAAAGTGGRTA